MTATMYGAWDEPDDDGLLEDDIAYSDALDDAWEAGYNAGKGGGDGLGYSSGSLQRAYEQGYVVALDEILELQEGDSA